LLGGEFALHGRYVEVDLNIGTDGLTVASVYIQTGEAGTDRQLEKERFMAALAHRMAMLTDRDAVVCGDWNIAHTENLTTVAFPEIDTAITHLREVLGEQTYESLAHKGETMTTAAMATYAYDQIEQARAELNAVLE
jgi:hypothetical protein